LAGKGFSSVRSLQLSSQGGGQKGLHAAGTVPGAPQHTSPVSAQSTSGTFSAGLIKTEMSQRASIIDAGHGATEKLPLAGFMPQSTNDIHSLSYLLGMNSLLVDVLLIISLQPI
jgi:hypothetical protein